MHFSQKAYLYNRTEFEFGEKKLDVLVDDGRLKIGFSVAYHEIGVRKSLKSFPEKAFLRYGAAIFLATILSYVIATSGAPGGSTVIFFAGDAVGVALCIASRYAKFDATRIPITPPGNTILVFHDDQHTAIIAEIYKRRKAEILRLYGGVDTLNHPQLEMKKFLWLKGEGVISEQEFEEARHKITAIGMS